MLLASIDIYLNLNQEPRIIWFWLIFPFGSSFSATANMDLDLSNHRNHCQFLLAKTADRYQTNLL